MLRLHSAAHLKVRQHDLSKLAHISSTLWLSLHQLLLLPPLVLDRALPKRVSSFSTFIARNAHLIADSAHLHPRLYPAGYSPE